MGAHRGGEEYGPLRTKRRHPGMGYTAEVARALGAGRPGGRSSVRAWWRDELSSQRWLQTETRPHSRGVQTLGSFHRTVPSTNIPRQAEVPLTDMVTNHGAQPHIHPRCCSTWAQLTWQQLCDVPLSTATSCRERIHRPGVTQRVPGKSRL